MSIFKRLIIASGLLVFGLPDLSQAGPIPPLFVGVTNQYKYTNLENVLDSSGNLKTINPISNPFVVGDRLSGVIWATTDQSSAGSFNISVAPAGVQVTGAFDLTIKAFGSNGQLILAPTSLAAANNPLTGLGLPTNTMVALYYAANTKFIGNGVNGQLYTDATRSAVATDATTGNLFGAFGYGSGYNAATFGVADAGAANIGYWYALSDGSLYNNGLKLLASSIIASTTPLVNKNLDLAFANIPAGSQIGNNATVPGTTKFDLVGGGTDSNNASATPSIRSDLYQIQSQDPERINVASIVPEPTSLVLFGLGTAFLGLVHLRRGKKIGATI
jgi:hypothetical protein